MKHTLMVLGLAACLAGSSVGAHADSVEIAKLKCGEFLQNKESIGMFIMLLDGYASQKSYNTVISDEWIEKLGKHMGTCCSQNPDTPILEAAQAMED